MKMRTLVLICAVAGMASSLLAASINLENYSFELPGTGKIRGWNGESGTDIPGWSSAGAAVDSGVESDWPGSTHGAWSGFLMGGDPQVFQITSYIIKPGDTFTLRVDARDNWSAATANFSYAVGAEDSSDGLIVGLNIYNQSWSERSLVWTVAPGSPAIGKKAAVALVNANPGDSWIGIDNVRLEVMPVPEPAAWTLIGLGALLLGLRRRA